MGVSFRQPLRQRSRGEITLLSADGFWYSSTLRESIAEYDYASYSDDDDECSGKESPFCIRKWLPGFVRIDNEDLLPSEKEERTANPPDLVYEEESTSSKSDDGDSVPSRWGEFFS